MIIDAYEERDVAIADIPGAYLHAEMPKGKNVLLKLEGEFVDIMCSVNPEHVKNIVYERKGRKMVKVLYLKVLRAIYGCLESALLWYNLYVHTLQGLGFELNPYDMCVANKIIDGSQCTIAFYVDDNKISHRDSKEVDGIIDQLRKEFGNVTYSRRKQHDFLRMDVVFKKTKQYLYI